MILILIALISIIALCIWANTAGHYNNFFTEFAAPLFASTGFVGLVIYSCLAWQYFAAEYRKDIINREYGTSYTQLEVFYASKVINTVRELERQRIEVNGDIITGE